MYMCFANVTATRTDGSKLPDPDVPTANAVKVPGGGGNILVAYIDLMEKLSKLSRFVLHIDSIEYCGINVYCDNRGCTASEHVVSDTLPTGWVRTDNRHLCPACTRVTR